MGYYEKQYKEKNHFSFGENWSYFLNTLDSQRILTAQASLTRFLGKQNSLKGKTFVDIGCGSGLFSLAAYKNGARKILSIDIDRNSVECTKKVKQQAGNPEMWKVKTGSVLNEKFLSTLGKFDVVYSWGVLHHSGDMYKAIDNTAKLVNNKGLLFLALYNRFNFRWYGGTSEFWLKIKTIYNSVPEWKKQIMLYIYQAYQISVLVVIHRRNPVEYIKHYKRDRGMSWKHDLVDWLGGLPYEYAGPDEIINYLGERGFACKKLTFRNGIGCNEYLFVKNGK